MTYRLEGREMGGYRDINVADLEKLPREVRFIDVREREEFDGELGHLARSELVPLGMLPAASARWDKESPLLLICRSGNRSSQAARALAKAGFVNLGNLAGGMLAVAGK